MNPRQLLETYHLLPKKSLGQNFMHDPNTLDKIVATAAVQSSDTVIEIGPGTGELTVKLAEAARQVIAIEIDDRLETLLADRLSAYRNVSVVFNDVLKTDIQKLVGTQPFLVVANVPYYITSAILRHVLEMANRPQRVVLTIQYEVAERLSAKPDDMSLLAVSVQYYGKPRLASRINRAVFWPRPDVDSAIVRIDTYAQPPVNVPNDDAFFRVVRAGFSQKRKQLRNALASGLNIKSEVAEAYLHAAGLDPQRRAETITLEEWAALTRIIHEQEQA